MTDGVEQEGLIEALRACGLLKAGGGATLRPLTGGVSSDVFRVDTGDGRALVVKRSIPRLRVKAEWLAPVERVAGEVRWLKLARSIDPRLAPEVLAELPEAHVFVMEFLDPAAHPVWKDEMAAGRVDPTFAAAVGRDLALIHARTAGRPDIAAAFDTYPFFFDLRVSPFLLFTAERHGDVAPRLRVLADDLGRRKVALMHGDVSPKNILVGPRGPVFLDAETTAYGDPAFDLAFCLTHLLLKTMWLRPHRERVMAAFEALRGAYAAGLTWEPPQGLSARAAPLTAALLLARIDGKSPAPYLTDPADKALVREAAKALLAA
ncbi:MAG TPA: aminoglycoside phosphotransferase family protein, partial [Caulobacteraceae bacterium]|nr:aminoglycoside phosphotransferase family protein [Caulobacteraceae bacterium]